MRTKLGQFMENWMLPLGNSIHIQIGFMNNVRLFVSVQLDWNGWRKNVQFCERMCKRCGNMWIELYFEHSTARSFVFFCLTSSEWRSERKTTQCDLSIVQFSEPRFLWENLQFFTYLQMRLHISRHRIHIERFESCLKCVVFQANTRKTSHPNHSFWIRSWRLFFFCYFTNEIISVCQRNCLPSIVSICENVTQFTHSFECNFSPSHSRREQIELLKIDTFQFSAKLFREINSRQFIIQFVEFWCVPRCERRCVKQPLWLKWTIVFNTNRFN